MDAIVVPEKMECAVFVGEVETRVINSNVENNNPQNSDLLVNDTEEHRSVEESNTEANTIVNLTERMDLDGKFSQFNISIGSCNTHDIQCLEDTSACTAMTESNAHVSDAEHITNKSVDDDYATMLDDD